MPGQTTDTLSGTLKRDYTQSRLAQQGAKDLGVKKKDRKQMLKIALMAARMRGE